MSLPQYLFSALLSAMAERTDTLRKSSNLLLSLSAAQTTALIPLALLPRLSLHSRIALAVAISSLFLSVLACSAAALRLQDECNRKIEDLSKACKKALDNPDYRPPLSGGRIKPIVVLTIAGATCFALAELSVSASVLYTLFS